ncbi:MAG: peptidoglycan DD-metalloendopeptidase family protein [Thermodesulfobacteriota bacterium]
MLYLYKAVFKIYIKPILLASAAVLFLTGSLHAYTAVVKSSKLNMRKSSTLNSPVVAVLTRGDKAEIIGDINGRWVKAVYNTKTGYLRNRPRYIEIAGGGENADAEKRKKVIEKKIKKEKSELEEYKKKSENILSGLNEIDKAVNNAEKKLDSVKKDYFDVNKKIRKEKQRIEKVEEEIKRLEPFVEKRIVSLYKLSNVGQVNLLFSADSVVDFIKRRKALKSIVTSDLKLIEEYAYYRKEYVELKKSLENESIRLEELQGEISKYLRIKEKEKEKKKALLSQIQQKEKLKLSVIKSLEKAAENLDEKIIELRKKEKKLEDNKLRSFKSHKGLLNIPVKGKIVSGFGAKASNNGYAYKSGIGIKADIGEPVRSVFPGEVVFSEWFKGYGNMMIINHGDSYYSVYAHVQEFFKQKGDSVRKDEVIATLGETGSMSGPVLHFEIRHHGDPLNPAKWLKK